MATALFAAKSSTSNIAHTICSFFATESPSQDSVVTMSPSLSHRSSGILLHPTSLPNQYGIGDLGPSAYRFADFLHASGQTLWQMLPLGPTGYGNSPYQCFSAFAGNPLLISPELLGLEAPPLTDRHSIDYGAVMHWKQSAFRQAFERFEAHANPADFEAFVHAEATWLEDYAFFMALKEAHGGEAVWTHWDPAIARREPAAMESWRSQLTHEIRFHQYLQFEFYSQFRALRRYCAEKGIRLMGDLPIYVAHDSADVWSNPDLFRLQANGNPVTVAGVPPDYFSSTGQLWGNPIYNWAALEDTGFAWWVERFRASFNLSDLVRLDHFRGLEAYWEVPFGDPTAERGQWTKAPGEAMLAAAEARLGPLPIVAENLGVITPAVEAIRERFGLPGMAVLQFAFGSDPQAPDFRPHNYPRRRVAYTGTHDNDTTVGWWHSKGIGDSTRTAEQVEAEKAFALRYLHSDGTELHWDMIRVLMASVADTVLFPLQDILGLGSEARMNQPATTSGNWLWRFTDGQLTTEIAHRLKELTVTYER